jgi:hypothetical protein
MRRELLFVIMLVAIAAATLPGVAAEPSPVVASPPPATVSQAVAAVVTAGQAAIADLETQARATADPEAAYAIALQIEQAKRDLLRDVITVQLECARRDGGLQQVAELEGALAQLAAPAEAQPQPRPIPNPAPAGR